MDEALEDLEVGEGNKFLALRGSLLDAQGHVRTDIFKPRGDIHLNAAGTQIVSLRIRKMLEIMLPNLVPVQTLPAPVQTPAQVQTPPAPVQTLSAKPQRTRVQAPVQDEVPSPVVVNKPPVVDTTLVEDVVNAPAVDQAPAGAPVAVVEMPKEVEDEDALLARLFFKRFGRALPETEKEKEKDVDINFVIDLTDEDEMEVATSDNVPAVAVVKTEPIEPIEAAETPEAPVVNVANVADAAKRRSFRLERLELAKARKAINEFGKSLRKAVIIPEKEPENVIADNDTDMAEDRSVNVESLTTTEAIEMAEAAIAESDAAIAANQKEIDKFFK